MPQTLITFIRFVAAFRDKKMFSLVGKPLAVLHTAVYYYMYAILGLMMSIPGPTLIDLEHSSNTNSKGISLIYVARSTGYLVGSLTGGVVLDYIPREEIAFIASSATIAIGAVLIPFCYSLPLILCTFFFAGFAIGFSNTGCNASCLRIWGKGSAPILQGLHLLYGLGALAAPLIAAPFLQDNLFSSSELILTTSSPNASIDSNEESTTIFSSNKTDLVPVELLNYPKITGAYGIVAFLASLVSFCFLLLIIYTRPQKKSSTKEITQEVKTKNQGIYFTVVVVVIACIITGLSSGIEVSFTQMLTSYVVSSSHALSKSMGSYITSVYWMAFTLMRFISIFLTCKLDIRKILVFVLVLSVSASLVLLIFGTWSFAALWIGAGLLGTAMAPVFPGILAWVERYININNRIASIFTLISCILEMVVPYTISTHLSTFPSILFTFLTCATILALILFLILNVILNRKGEKYETQSEQSNDPEESIPVKV